MRKDDVEVRQDGPAVNVKVRGSLWDVKLPLELGQVSDDGGKTWQTVTTADEFTHDWIEENLPERTVQAFYDMALEGGWEQLQSEAEDIFGDVKVYSDGRSGGWAVVTGLPDVESWDAIAVGRWARFEKIARAIAADMPRAAVDLIHASVYVVET